MDVWSIIAVWAVLGSIVTHRVRYARRSVLKLESLEFMYQQFLTYFARWENVAFTRHRKAFMEATAE